MLNMMFETLWVRVFHRLRKTFVSYSSFIIMITNDIFIYNINQLWSKKGYFET